MQPEDILHRLGKLQTPHGTVGEWASYLLDIFLVFQELLVMGGRDSLFFIASLALNFVQVPLGLMAASSWPWVSAAMDSGSDFWGALVVMGALGSILGVVGFFKNRMNECFQGRFLARVQTRAVQGLLQADVAFWDVSDPAQQVFLVFDMAEKVSGFMLCLESMVSCICVLGGGVYHLFSMSPTITTGAIAIMATYGLWSVWLNSKLAWLGTMVEIAHADLQAGAIESLTNIRTVQSFTSERIELLRFGLRKLAWWQGKIKFRIGEFSRRSVQLIVEYARPAAINYTGFNAVQVGKLLSSQVIIFQSALDAFLVGSFDAVVNVLRGVSVHYGLAKFFLLAIKSKPDIPYYVGSVPDHACKGNIVFEDVAFAYPSRPSDTIVQKVSFQIPAGSFAAFVGSSGSGKTTVGRLLQRFYDVQEGAVTLDGHLIRDLQPRWLRNQIGYVEQEPKLFRGTIASNILYGAPAASAARVGEAARMAGVAKFAAHLPQGLETEVSQLGRSLSGGQKQRVAIARAVLKDPAVLLMDEATSALDTETEREVQEALESVMQGRTTVVIAHRLTTVLKATQIIVMDRGRIIETGSPSELSAKPAGAFAALMQHQLAGTGGGEAPEAAPQPPAEAAGPPVDLTGDPHAGTGGEGAGDAGSPAGQPQLPPPDALVAPSDALQQPLLEKQPGKELLPNLERFPGAYVGRRRIIGAHELPYSSSLGGRLAWMVRMMGRNKYLLAMSVFLCLLEARAHSLTGPCFAATTSHLDDADLYRPVFWAYVSCLAQAAGFCFIKEMMRGVALERLEERLQYVSLTLLIQQDAYYFDQNEPGIVTSKIFEQIAKACGGLNLLSEAVLHSLVNILLLLFRMFVLSPAVMVWSLLLLIPIVVFFCVIALFQGNRGQAVTDAHAHLKDRVLESLGNIRTVVSFAAEDFELEQFKQQKAAWWKAEMSRRRPAWLTELLGGQIMPGIGVAVLAVIYSYHTGRSSGIAAALMYMVKELGASVSALTFTLGSLGELFAAMGSLAETLELAPLISPDVGESPQAPVRGEISIQDVRFAYPQSLQKEVLSGISFKVQAGTFTAVVGQSGSGKTTLGRLLLRLYDVQGGQICLDGHPIRDVNPHWLRSQIGFVEQEPKLFKGSIRDNIVYAAPMAGEQDVMRAAEAARVLAFASSLPQGMETDVGRYGQSLSGGQKQRVAMARTILKGAPVLLLDEATSALDSQTERLLQEALEQVMAGRTSLVIAHRMSTVAKADQVVVMDGGHVVQVGSHSELAEQGGAYSQLVRTLAQPAESRAEECNGGDDDDAPDGGDDNAQNEGVRRRK
mmetsp:Transcript_46441/g.132385  ORF Transcript_46441/g.132385 Transcript_46441/m.132385 type:complete len:1311 (-) Transcript_46441:103-4035(-)